ncbi:DMT family transporter [Sporolactobacillus nakayamae]|uniref:Threonine/homoserine efflux transporter RhtA n=1 Tax=Sporolactobacillus nakayamae TaxID=269670 RepID=A0A1I2PYX1_9BACL|nr:EamA family transporter [Sporolactobacillus nakayamae]SFG20603.1 Threonine/homoserine efflux transporter RhtA [Sporolactobacillus nakayamae]
MTEFVQRVTRVRSWKRPLGMMLVLSGATLWGVSGNVAQYLFERQQIDAGWLTSVRMLAAGILLLALTQGGKDRRLTWTVWRRRKSAAGLLIFGLIGMIGAQYTYFEAIAAGNAATATLLQYLSPVLIMLYLIIRWRKKPSVTEIAAIFTAILGVFLLVTKGHPDQISIAPLAVFWGLMSALGGAIYAIQPGALLKKYGPGLVVGWGMVIGGAAMSCFFPPWKFHGVLSVQSLAGVVFVILFGTLLAFYLYLASLKYLKPIETSLLGCAEPLSAAVVSVVWMHVPFTLVDWIGAICIIGTVIMLALAQKAITTK